MKFTIRKKTKEKDYHFFKDLVPGQFFFDEDNDLALKVKEQSSNYYNAILIEHTESYCYEDNDKVIPVDHQLYIYVEE